MSNKKAFTLAEVLITLGIIGVVAAMTMPVLIQNYKNHVVETRLMKFYSAINQAVKLAEVDFGDKSYWFDDLAGAELDNEGKPVAGTSASEKWFNKYFAPYLKIIKTETLSDGALMVYFPDGSALRQLSNSNTRDWTFFPGNAKKCNDTLPEQAYTGICGFSFNFYAKPNSEAPELWKYLNGKLFEPFKYGWDGTTEFLEDKCINGNMFYTVAGKNYCTALIQANGWKIPKNYPYKVWY